MKYKNYLSFKNLFLVNALVILAAFGWMLREHYSPDTYFVILDTVNQPVLHTTSGRFVYGLFFALSNRLGLSVGIHFALYTLLFMLVSAWCVTRITWVFKAYARDEKRKSSDIYIYIY